MKTFLTQPTRARFLVLFALVTLLVLLAAKLHAQTVNLAWDASTSTNVTYRVYASTNTLPSTNSLTINSGTNLTASYEGILPGRYSFATTAVSAEGIESELSNIVLGEVPPPPAQMRTLFIQTSGTLTGTNWQNAGYFKIGIEP